MLAHMHTHHVEACTYNSAQQLQPYSLAQHKLLVVVVEKMLEHTSGASLDL
jgi:hypothetical protein